jgi:hypothetical protein
VLGAVAAGGVVVVATGTVVVGAEDALVVGAGGGSEDGDATAGDVVDSVVGTAVRACVATTTAMSPAYAATKIEARAVGRAVMSMRSQATRAAGEICGRPDRAERGPLATVRRSAGVCSISL